jgi:Transposase IS116/IS110/IS902 family
VRTARQQLSAFLLRHERIYPNGGKAWTKAHRGWLANQNFAQPAQQIVLEESIEAVRLGEQRRDRVDGYLRTQIPTWSLFPLVQNLGALRGLDTIASAGLAAAIGDPSRFASAPDFMAYLGLVPSEHSSGPRRRMGGITKSGDIHPSSGYSNGFAAGTLASLARTPNRGSAPASVSSACANATASNVWMPPVSPIPSFRHCERCPENPCICHC